jgi:hypothetical protein
MPAYETKIHALQIWEEVVGYLKSVERSGGQLIIKLLISGEYLVVLEDEDKFNLLEKLVGSRIGILLTEKGYSLRRLDV